MINNSPSPSTIFRSRNNRSANHPTHFPLQPERQDPHRLHPLLGTYSSGCLKFGNNKFPVDTKMRGGWSGNTITVHKTRIYTNFVVNFIIIQIKFTKE